MQLSFTHNTAIWGYYSTVAFTPYISRPKIHLCWSKRRSYGSKRSDLVKIYFRAGSFMSKLQVISNYTAQV